MKFVQKKWKNDPRSMKHLYRGCNIPDLDHRDRDYLKSFHPAILAGSTTVPTFPDDYDTDAHLWMPNQNEVNPQFPNTPPQPEGCTNYTTGDVATDLDGVLRDPAKLEAVTHANASGGYDIRQSLIAGKNLGYISSFYNIKAYAPLDYFDALRLASFSGLPEKRSISIGTPWYHEWQSAVESGQILMPSPMSLDYTGIGWHNWKIGGWKTRNGSPRLRCKPWEGKDIGDAGWLEFDRPTINRVMNLRYTIAFTATHTTPTSIYKIDMAYIDKMESYLKTFLGLRY